MTPFAALAGYTIGVRTTETASAARVARDVELVDTRARYSDGSAVADWIRRAARRARRRYRIRVSRCHASSSGFAARSVVAPTSAARARGAGRT